MGDVAAHEPTVFACAVLAGPDGTSIKAEWPNAPTIPTVEELEKLFKSKGVQVEVVKY